MGVGLPVLSLDGGGTSFSRLPGGRDFLFAGDVAQRGEGGAGGGRDFLCADPAPQFIVGEDGTCGVVYDPAVIDGAVVAEMVDHALDYW